MKKIIKGILIIVMLYCIFNYKNITFIQEIIEIYRYQQQMRNEGNDVMKETLNEYQNDIPLDDQIQKEDENKLESNPHQGVYKQYYYEHLDGMDKTLYEEIFEGICLMKDEIQISSNDSNLISNVIKYITYDNPNLYYFDPTQNKYTITTTNNTYKLSLVYTMNETKVNEFDKQLNDIVDPIIEEAKMLENEYEKCKFVFDYIVNHCNYVDGVKESQNILSVFIYNESVCAGYARSMKYLLDFLDIESCVLSGTAKEEAHAALMVRIDDHYYYFDPTWADPRLTNDQSEEDLAHYKFMRYSYFAMSDVEFSQYFNVEEKSFLQKSTSDEANYFVRNDLLITNVDEFKTLLNDMKEQDMYAFKCSDQKTYQEITRLLQNDKETIQSINSRYVYQTIDETKTIAINKN